MAPTWRRFPARGLLARLALFALFAVALVLLRAALSARWNAGEARARGLFADAPAPAAPGPATAEEGAP